jgi:multidrug resistance efflux pump
VTFSPPPRENSTAENLAGVKATLAEAKANYKRAANVYNTAEIGSEELNQARVDLSRYKADITHWEEYVRYYTKVLEAEVAVAGTTSRARGERFPGEDDLYSPDETDW